jgi:hypothetical protein
VSGDDVVTKTLSPETIGDDRPSPGIATFQRMFFVGDHSNGAFVSRLIPSPRCPRHMGQSSATIREIGNAVSPKKAIAFRFIIGLGRWLSKLIAEGR